MLLNRETSGSRWRIRPDGPGKVTGSLAYLTDMAAPGMLYGLIARSPHPHANIVSIRTEKAEALPGVYAVLTYRDVPGLNRYGIAHPDQPVLCEDKVRYIGDAVAAVAADSLDAARQALALIEVEYELLPVVDDAEEALREDSPKLHPQGNLLHHADYYRGARLEEGFAQCAYVVEQTYRTPRQMHTYMETEGGLFVPEDDGRLTVYSPTQHGRMDRFQLSRILDWPEEQIRIISSPIGGSFGGKDELNVQPYGALLAVRTGRPVKIHQSRWDSVRAGLKRHPMKITMKTGCSADGRLIAHEVRIVADTGPYATLGAEVLNFAVEHVIGPYRYDFIAVNGYSVFTNNGMSGEFRGFGGNQAIFALEGQLDRLAAATGIDPWTFRKINMRHADDLGPFGQPIALTNGAEQVWTELEQSPLWQERMARKAAAKKKRPAENEGERPFVQPENSMAAALQPPWIKTGIGAAFTMHGAGLGAGLPDPAGGRLKLREDGKIEAAFGYEEFGQGLIASLMQMLIEQFGFASSDIAIVIGDTDLVPDSGSTTASRATSMMWKSLQRMKQPFTELLLSRASELLGEPKASLRLGEGGIWRGNSGEAGGFVPALSYAELAERSGDHELQTDTAFRFPATSFDRVGAHFMYTYSAVAVKVEVNELTGRVTVIDQFHTVAAGPVINPQGFLGQIEGGSNMALGFTITEDAVMDKGFYLTRNLDTYLVPTIADSRGTVTVSAIDQLPEGDDYGPRGIGEVGSVTLAPAIVQAIFEATGKWVSKLPIDPELLQEKFCDGEAAGANE
ncbi:xanthine dehydrogenase subunit D [Paenibacillus protaetiae]|uniref:Xanthine dehydrogenase subunit D n=1 Tax=Paenibacillus protaetiae TaxID=2509456 RepID=A0A4P6F5N5_9BACL|nr:xanthine dehydrogenase subunit D [Paenibacillus protaetiae]QAY65718.1 xanthine dehydrogenase subunit D [Paenibacillus protaetiae]